MWFLGKQKWWCIDREDFRNLIERSKEKNKCKTYFFVLTDG